MNPKIPLYSFAALGLFLVALVVILLFGDTSNTETVLFIGTLLANVPGLVAAFMSERSNAAIHNGVVQEKAKQGAIQALEITGITQVANNSQQATVLAMNALSRLLETNTSATQQNTAKLGENDGKTV